MILTLVRIALAALSLTALNPIARTATAPAGHPMAARAGQWTSIGSAPVWNGDSQYPWAGRVTAIAVHPADTRILYAGGASGGIWKSINGGQS